jgi:hypothetical protein
MILVLDRALLQIPGLIGEICPKGRCVFRIETSENLKTACALGLSKSKTTDLLAYYLKRMFQTRGWTYRRRSAE